MEQNQNRLAPEAPADESASPFNPAAEQGPDSDPPLISDSLDDALQETLDTTFTPESRKPRHDGWTPEAVAGFLYALAESGVVEHAARRVGLSAQSAYAFRNRRQGRAFAKMWDAVLINRVRARIEGELQGRAIAGCVSIRKRDGVIVGEYHYYDNRLAMSLLTRLDRIAEREEASEAHLRALSEDLDDFCDCLAEGGDPDAFIEARRPEEPDPEIDDEFDDEAEAESDEAPGTCEVWQDGQGRWWTEFPPPAGFAGEEEGEPGDPDYCRALTDGERAVVEADAADELAGDIADSAARRDRYFGFAPDLAEAEVLQPDGSEAGEAAASSAPGSDGANGPPEEDRGAADGAEA